MPRTFTKAFNHLGRLFTPKPVAQGVDMTGRHVIVTGAAPRSLGYETARILASWGARVTVTSRHHVERMERSLKADLQGTGGNGANIDASPLDLADAESVRRFAAWYAMEHDEQLHVLVNNAGIHRNIFRSREKPPLTRDGFEAHWRINYLGAFHLTSLLLPLLRKCGRESGDARVVNVSSHLHDRVKNENLFRDSRRYHSWDAYGLSKLALIHFSFEIQRRFAARYRLQSVALHPGSVHTNLTQAKDLEGKIGGGVQRITSRLASLVLLPLHYGAQTTVMCASQRPIEGGKYYYRCSIAEPSVDTRDASVARRLWEESEAWVRTLADSRRNEHVQV